MRFTFAAARAAALSQHLRARWRNMPASRECEFFPLPTLARWLEWTTDTLSADGAPFTIVVAHGRSRIAKWRL